MLVTQTLDAHWSLPQLWLSGKDTGIEMIGKKGITLLGRPLQWGSPTIVAHP